MAKVAVLMAEGYEEGETLTIVDILRRADIETATFYFEMMSLSKVCTICISKQTKNLVLKCMNMM